MRRGALSILALAAIWRIVFLLEIHGTPLGSLHEWNQSDMSTFLLQAKQFAAGDWLARAPYYPYHEWMRAIPQPEWAKFHPAMMYYQPPLYSYALAGLMKLGLDAGGVVPWMQAALGVLSCALMMALASRLFGKLAGLAAGFLQAVYGPLMMAESQVLRDGPLLAEMLLLILLTVDTLGRERRGTLLAGERRWRAWLIGLLAGFMMMLHEGTMFLGIYAALWGMGNAWRRAGKGAALQWGAILALGGIVGFSPMLARNAALGQPLASRYFGSTLAMATANHPDVPDLKMLPTDAARFNADMREAQGDPGKLLLRIVRESAGAPMKLAGKWLWRLAALAIGPEADENLNYSYFKENAAILNLALDFRWVGPLALAGGIALGFRRWRARLGGGLGFTACFVATMIGLVSLVQPYGRYRLIFLPLVMPLAGFAIVKLGCLIERARRREKGPILRKHRAASFRRRIAPLGKYAALIAVLALMQASLMLVPSLKGLTGPRTIEYLVTSRILLGWGHPDAAAAVLLEGLDRFPGNEQTYIEWLMAEAMVAQEKKDYPKALENWKHALEIRPGMPLALLGAQTASKGEPLAAAPEAISGTLMGESIPLLKK